MRLGQLARKLALRPAEIVEFLAENRIQIGEGANVRLENDQVSMIMKKFVPGWIETNEGENEPAEEEFAVENISGEQPVANEEVSFGDNNPESPDANVVGDSETSEIIKAPKIELSGLKVLGKIELPEPKKKETPANPIPEEAQVAEGDKKGVKDSRRPYEEKRRREYRPEKNPIALQREREAKEAQRKLQEQVAREKEKKTQKYLRKVKMSPPTKAVRLVDEPVMEMTAEELVEGPKTLFGKIMRWLTKAS